MFWLGWLAVSPGIVCVRPTLALGLPMPAATLGSSVGLGLWFLSSSTKPAVSYLLQLQNLPQLVVGSLILKCSSYNENKTNLQLPDLGLCSLSNVAQPRVT